MMKRNTFLLLSILTASMIGLVSLFSSRPSAVQAEQNVVASGNWGTEFEISTGSARAQRPAIATAPNGKTVLVTYIEPSSDAVSNVKYSFSTNNGKAGSWQTNRPIHTATAKKSEQTHVAFDQNNKAHVVWVEDSRLAYANSSNLSSGFGTPKYFSASPAVPGANNPFVITYGNTTVHIIWAEGDTGNPGPNIKHVQSTNGGSSWGSTTFITDNNVQSEKPSAAVDADGNLYIVYQQQARFSGGNILNDIFYVKGTRNGSSFTWSTPTNINSKIPAGAFTMVEPSIIYNNGRLEVSATQQFPNSVNAKEAPYFIQYITCTTSCGNSNNWNPEVISEPDGSGEALFVDITPSNIVSSIVKLGTCTTIVFDGKVSFTQDDSEQIFNSSSCNSWGNGRQDLTFNDESRSIQPVAATQNNWWMYVAYEEFVNEGNAEKIYFIGNIPAVYLPVITK